MTKRMKIAIGLLIPVSAVFWWYVFAPTYKKTVYKLAQCGGQTVTMVEYRTLTDRGVAFVYGEYEGNEIPEKESLVQKGLSGLDSSFYAIITCQNDTITVNYDEAYLTPNPKATKIIGKELSTSEFDSLKRVNIGQSISVH